MLWYVYILYCLFIKIIFKIADGVNPTILELEQFQESVDNLKKECKHFLIFFFLNLVFFFSRNDSFKRKKSISSTWR